jgi:antitoxin component HigA of HigAB toxin-antitoxin module
MTEQEYRQKLDVVCALVALDPGAETHAGRALDELSAEVEAYELEHFPLPPLDEAAS